jgi:N-acetylglucosaminyldiphosphoundecaprenol N-acetyl-beta-D-mannosaminyltransferase
MSRADRRVEVFGLRVFNDDLATIPLREGGEARCRTVTTISPNSYGIATKDPAFWEALKAADYLVLDGVYFGLAAILLKRRTITPNQGPEVFDHFMKRLNGCGGRAFFLGASQGTLDKIQKRAAELYPNIAVASLSPPYKPEFSEAENAKMIETVNAFAPDVLFIGMTAPKQEKWAHQHQARLKAGLAASIGGVFDWFAGNEKPIARIWWKLKLGWLVRTIRRPEILRRYPDIGIFFWHLALAMVGIRRWPA